MEDKQQDILLRLIEDYIESAEPIGSQALVKKHELSFSPATIRNYFNALEHVGYLTQPHTSAGRIPTEKAFHWYIERIEKASLAKKEQAFLQSIKSDSTEFIDQIKLFAKGCVQLTGVASLIGSSKSDTYYTGLTELFSQPEFKDWSRVVNMGSILDELNERMKLLREHSETDIAIKLGSECPFGNGCGSIMMMLPKQTLFVLLGPMRMDYKKAYAALGEVKQLINAYV